MSLVPSATEIVAAMACGEWLVGISHECDYPPEFAAVPRLTRSRISAQGSLGIDQQVREMAERRESLYDLDEGLLASLHPDVIITQSLCDVCAVRVEALENASRTSGVHPQVVTLRPTRFSDLFDGIREIGAAVGHPGDADQLSARLRERVDFVVNSLTAIESVRRVVLLEWIEPMFSAGHWNPDLIRLAGGRDELGTPGMRSRVVSWEDLLRALPEVLVVASCGYSIPRTQAEMSVLTSHPLWRRLPCVESGEVYIADGSALFNRPGPRLVDSLELLAHLLHPAHVPLPGSGIRKDSVVMRVIA